MSSSFFVSPVPYITMENLQGFLTEELVGQVRRHVRLCLEERRSSQTALRVSAVSWFPLLALIP